MSDLFSCREKILSEDYRDFITTKLRKDDFAEFFSNEVCQQEIAFLYSNLYIDKEKADPISFERYSYNSIPKCYTLTDLDAMSQAGILQIQNYPTLQLQGTGVMIGFVDTGIDYQNPIFQNIDGSTRIAGIWDQTVQTGNPPKGLFFGTEYREEKINEALRSENPLQVVQTVDENSHGTFLASIAAGGIDLEKQFVGAAPDSTLAVVKLKPAKQYLKDFYEIHTNESCYQENDIMLGIRYLHDLASERNMPLVICIALGTNQGGHSGISPLCGLLEFMSSIEQRVVVIGAGNEANERHHYMGNLLLEKEKEEIEIRVGEETKGFTMELWTENPNVVAVTVISPTGGTTGRVATKTTETQKFSFVFEGTTVSIDYLLFLEQSNSELVFFRFDKPSAGIWKVIVEPVKLAEGIFHMWLPVKEFLDREVYFLESNPNYTITEPGSTITGITVGFYKGDDNSVAISSGRGYTRNRSIKPNFVAPGVDVLGATIRKQYAQRTGSSIAVGITAGACALLMEWILFRLGKESVDPIQIRNLLTLGTGKTEGETYPNAVWGYGRLNLFGAFDEIRRI